MGTLTVPQFRTLRLHVSFLATFITFKFTFFRRLFTSCLWYLTSIATCVLNRFVHLSIRHCLSSSTSQCYFNHPFYHILVCICIAMRHFYWHSGSDVISLVLAITVLLQQISCTLWDLSSLNILQGAYIQSHLCNDWIIGVVLLIFF